MAKRGPIQLDAIGVPVDGGRSGGFIGRCFRLVARFQDIKLARSDGIVFLLIPLSVPTTGGAVVWSELPVYRLAQLIRAFRWVPDWAWIGRVIFRERSGRRERRS
jgi:hypothetical protein